MTALMTRPVNTPDLSELILEELPDVRSENFKIDSMDKAAWGAKKYLEALHRVEERSALVQQYRDKLDKWEQSANADDLSTVAYFQAQLRPWVESSLAKGVKGRSVLVPGARIGLRKKPDRVEITNPLVAFDACEKDFPHAIVVKKELSKTELKQVLLRGYAIPGVEIIEGGEDLTVKEE